MKKSTNGYKGRYPVTIRFPEHAAFRMVVYAIPLFMLKTF
jgi:hypothetical protein